MVGNWRIFHNEERHNLYSSPNKIRRMKSRKMSWAGNITRKGKKRNADKIMVRKPEERDHYEDLDVDERITLHEVLGRTKSIVSFDTTRTAQKAKRLGAIHRHTGVIDRHTDSKVFS
jgi:hypothetical protein